jgi:pimeloyl-ACP methyl ester carboxylesterase
LSVLRVLDAGAAAGPIVVFFHGTPASRLVPGPWLEAVADAGIRLLSCDRPGYGGSTPRPGRSVANAAADVAAVVNELGVGRFAVWGVGGGSPHALACAALLADRVVAAAAVEPVAPYDAPGLDWLAGMGEGNVQEFTLALGGRDALRAALIPAAERLKAVDPAQDGEVFGAGHAPPDRAILASPRVAAFLLACMREGLATGVEGWVQDDLALVAPGGVELGGIGVPVALWHGAQGRLVPATHARWLAAAIPGAALRLLPEEGTLSMIFGRASEVIGWLAEQLRRTR